MNEQKKTNYLDEVLTGKLHHLPMGEKESKQKKIGYTLIAPGKTSNVMMISILYVVENDPRKMYLVEHK